MKLIIILAFGLLSSSLFAQQRPTSLALSLEEARALALKNNPKLAAGALDLKRNAEKIAEAKLKRIPQVYADMNLQRNLVIPVTPVPANAFNPDAAEGELRPLRFSTKWTANAGLNANIDLFNPQAKLAVQEAKVNTQLNQLDYTGLEIQLAYDVAQAYIAALIAKEQLRLSVADTSTKAEILKITEQQFREGRLLLSALNQVKTERNTGLNNFEEARQILENRQAELLYYLGYSPEDAIKLEFLDSLDTLFLAFQKSADTLSLPISADTDLGMEGLAGRKLLQSNLLLDQQIKASLRAYLPAVTLKGYYGANYFDNNFELFKGQNWNGNSFINLGLRVPITEGMERQKRINQYRLEKQANDLRYQDQYFKRKLDYLSAFGEAAVLERNYRRVQENFILAEKNLRLAEQQFAAGRLLLTDLQQINYQFQLEKNNYLQLAYNFISAKLNLEKLSRE